MVMRSNVEAETGAVKPAMSTNGLGCRDQIKLEIHLQHLALMARTGTGDLCNFNPNG